MPKSNFTLQYIANSGFTIVESLAVDVATTPTQIQPITAGPFNAMWIKGNGDISGGQRAFLGTDTVTVNDGFPIFDFDGLGHISNTAEGMFILTSSPSDFYLIGNVGHIDVRVMLLAYDS